MIVRLMPHEVADLEPVLLMLSKQDVDDLQVVWLLCIIMHAPSAKCNVNAFMVCY